MPHAPAPAFPRLVAATAAAWPEHRAFLDKRIAGRSPGHLAMAEDLSRAILAICGDAPDALIAGYRWTCERMLDEELFFRRHGRYRVTLFQEALDTVYADPEVMRLYVDGLLLSQVLWSNHTDAALWYVERFLAANPADGHHLEIGPGHGLLLYLAARDGRGGALTGWDVSATSLEATRHALDILGIGRPVTLEQRDIFAGPLPEAAFDSIVLSEILEHLERPDLALEQVRVALRPGGRLFVNVPVNSPAPDHIHCLTQPEQVVELVEKAGYVIEDSTFFPAVGYTPERARKVGAAMSSVVIATLS